MNNRGQTLVVFILLLPLILLLMAFVINEGFVLIAKRSLNNNVKEAINYRFELEETDLVIKERIENYLYKNIKNIDSLDIVLDDNYVKITASINVKAELPMIIKRNSFTITTAIAGHLSDGLVTIIKE